MSIKLVCGEPGAGKSLYTMRQVMDLIVVTDLPIVTNLPIRLDPWMLGNKPQQGLKAYLKQNHGDTFDIDRRFTAIPDEECAKFFLNRGFGVKLETENEDEYDIQKAAQGPGVIYIIDEAWKFFSSRDWQKNSKALIFYAKQHRKLGDEVFICTHQAGDLDKGIRGVAETTTVMANHGRMRIGFFRQPGYFSASHYQNVPTGNQPPMHVERFKLDAAGIAGTYDTSAGVGLTGGKAADTKQKKSGIPFWVLILLVLAGAAAVTQFPKLIGKLVGGATLGAAKSASEKYSIKSDTNAVHHQPSSAPTNLTPMTPTELRPTTPAPRGKPVGTFEFEEPAPKLEKSDDVALVGIVYNPSRGKSVIMLSDGRKYNADDPFVRLITPEFVVIGETVFKWARQVEPLQPKVTQRNSGSAGVMTGTTENRKVARIGSRVKL